MLKWSKVGAYAAAVASLAPLGITGTAFRDPSLPCSVRKEVNVPAKMRDGIILCAKNSLCR
jgi:hypothetical protein